MINETMKDVALWESAASEFSSDFKLRRIFIGTNEYQEILCEESKALGAGHLGRGWTEFVVGYCTLTVQPELVHVPAHYEWRS